jgi:hypothetical protein
MGFNRASDFMNTTRIEIRAQREPWRYAIALYFGALTDEAGRRTYAVAEPVKFRATTEDEAIFTSPSPTFAITESDAQQFMDELWRLGIRPTDGTGSVGQLAAVHAHLEDMRTLVFKGKGKA